LSLEQRQLHPSFASTN
jgi:hypothetical protein